MSDNIQNMCEDIDQKGIRAKCLFNWDTLEYTVEVSYENTKHTENWKCNYRPTFGMDVLDIAIWQEKAEQLAQLIERELGI